jgi:hypothetical protein
MSEETNIQDLLAALPKPYPSRPAHPTFELVGCRLSRPCFRNWRLCRCRVISNPHGRHKLADYKARIFEIPIH